MERPSQRQVEVWASPRAFAPGARTALEALGNAPESVSARMGAIDAARRVTDQFAFMTDTLQQMRGEADQEIAAAVDRVNGLLADLQDLNQLIAGNSATGESTADLEDKRDVLIDKLAEDIDIRYFTRASGEVVISTTSGRPETGFTAQERSGAARSASHPCRAFMPGTVHDPRSDGKRGGLWAERPRAVTAPGSDPAGSSLRLGRTTTAQDQQPGSRQTE